MKAAIIQLLIGEGAAIFDSIEVECLRLGAVLVLDDRAGLWPPQMGALISFPMIYVAIAVIFIDYSYGYLIQNRYLCDV